jgi:metallo-beta-lactamase family protein
MIEFEYNGKRLVFTGDLGNSPAPLLQDTEPITNANYLVMESVYGDRNHEDRAERQSKLEDVIEDTMRRGGTLLIPAFSIERTQEILFEIENMMESSRIPLVPVFLDSPLAITITKIYKKFDHYLNQDVKEVIRLGDGIFKFPQLHYTLSTEESKSISHAAPRKIIIAGSGMSMGGRIIHHEKRFLSDPKTTLLLMGYQAPGSMGRVLQDGARSVRILGEEIPVNARIATISGYSAHKDSQGLFDFVKNSADTLENIYVVMGEPKSALFLVQRLRDYLGLNAEAPQAGQSVELNF